MNNHVTLFLPFENSVTENLGSGALSFSVSGSPTITTCPSHPIFTKAMLCNTEEYIYAGNLNFYNNIIQGTNDFTIDWWGYYDLPVTGGNNWPDAGFNITQNNRYVFYTEHDTNNTGMVYSWGFSAVGQNGQYPVSNILAAGEEFVSRWNHYAIVLKGNEYITFLNGKQKGRTTSTDRVYPGSNCLLKIGNRSNPLRRNYYYKNMRVSNIALFDKDFDPYDFIRKTDSVVYSNLYIS